MIEAQTLSIQHHDRALELLEARRVSEACAAFDAAEHFGFDPNECRAGRWTCFMLLGRFAEAWHESDLIEASSAPQSDLFWDGQPFSGKRVIVRCLHGLGDTIQFIRYAPMIRSQAARLIVEAHPELTRILQLAEGVEEVITWGEAAPAPPAAWDSQIEINELPLIFRTTLQTIPCRIPYIQIPEDVAMQSPLVKSRKLRPRVGLVWSSSQWNPARCVPLPLLTGAVGQSRLEMLSLQHGPERHLLPTARDEVRDVLDTAADMMHLDLIISADTMTAHLAGALGRPVWLLLPFEADWRWMLDRHDSPWYPTMRIFRQKRPGDWPGVLQEVRDAALAF